MKRQKLDDGRECLLWEGGIAAPKQKATHLKAGVIHGIASTDQVDRDGERIASGAFDKSLGGFMQNPVLLWAHQHAIPAIGRVIDFARKDSRYEFDAEFAVGAPGSGNGPDKFFSSPPARPDPGLLHWLYERGFMRAFSVGFIPEEWTDDKDAKQEGQEGSTYTQGQLIELSCCNVPSNPGALALAFAGTAKALGLDLDADPIIKGPIAPHRPAKAPEGVAWDAAAVLRQVEGARQLRSIHAWVNSDADAEAKSSYKLPHHLADGRVVFRGVAAAMGALLGARGGVSVPDGDRAGVHRHLATHYSQFDREPPELRDWDAQELLLKIFDDMETVSSRRSDVPGKALAGVAPETASVLAQLANALQ